MPDSQTGAPETRGLTDFVDGPNALHDKMGIVVVEATKDRVVATMPVEGNQQPFGLLHGGASCVLAESAGSICATLNGLPEKVAVGTDISASHHRSARMGVVAAVARPIHVGRTVASIEIVISDGDERRICTARLTCQLVPASTTQA